MNKHFLNRAVTLMTVVALALPLGLANPSHAALSAPLGTSSPAESSSQLQGGTRLTTDAQNSDDLPREQPPEFSTYFKEFMASHPLNYSVTGPFSSETAFPQLQSLELPATSPVGDSSLSSVSSTVPVSITDAGFDPATITVTVGTTVVWTNHTQETVHLTSGQPYRIYLPLVLRNVGGVGAAAASPLTVATVLPQQDNWADVDITTGGSYSHTFTAVGVYPYFLSNDPHLTGQVTVEPIAFDFALGVQPAVQSVLQGQDVTYAVQVTGTLGDPQPVTLTVGGLPMSATWDLSPSTVIPTTTVVLSLATALTTPVGGYTLVVTGTSASRVHTTTATLSVTPHPDFTISVQPPVQTVMQAQSVTYTVRLTSEHGFADAVALSLEGLPAGATAEWSANPVVPSASTILTVTAGTDTVPGGYTLVVTGAGGGLLRTATAVLGW